MLVDWNMKTVYLITILGAIISGSVIFAMFFEFPFAKEHFEIQITGLKDTYLVGEQYSFSYILSGYGDPCGGILVTYPINKTNTLSEGTMPGCLKTIDTDFVLDIKKEYGKTFGHVALAEPGNYTVLVQFEKGENGPTVTTKSFEVVRDYETNKMEGMLNSTDIIGNYSNQECADLFDKIFDTWQKYADENYGGPGQPVLEPPTVAYLIANWEGGKEFRDSDCRFRVNDWSYLVKHQDQVWGYVDWPELKPEQSSASGIAGVSSRFQDTVQANNQFAVDYYKQVNENKNIFFSPWSITSAFAVVSEGAKGNTASEIQSVFGFDENSKEDFKVLDDLLNKVNPGYTIEVANSLWLAQNLALNSDFADTIAKYYDGSIQKVNFAGNATDVINGWVSNKTRDKIPELFSPPLDPNTRLVVANAIYFNGTWRMPFDERNTKDDKFIISPETYVTVPFMTRDSYYNHTAIDDFQIIELPYAGDAASMLILLPDKIDGLDSLEAKISADNLKTWTSNMKETRLFLQMPRFTLDTEYDLVKDLSALGINDAFGPADLTGITPEPLSIDRAVHKAFVDVNEKGTEAAAATGIHCENQGLQASLQIIPLSLSYKKRILEIFCLWER